MVKRQSIQDYGYTRIGIIMSENDPFEVIGDVPDGWSYQWVAKSILGSESLAEADKCWMERNGWRPVPPERHPEMPCKDGQIEVGSCVLMERPAELTKAANEKTERAARDMACGALDHVTIPATDVSPRFQGRPDGDAEAPDAYKDAEAPVTVTVTLPLHLPINLVTAAKVCGITPDEYARRVIILMMRGDLNYTLLPTADRKAFELFDRLIVVGTDKGNSNG